MNDDIKKDRAALAEALSDDCDFIAIVEASEGAIADPRMRKRLILLGGIAGETDEAKTQDARLQVERKSRPWEQVIRLYRLVPVR